MAAEVLCWEKHLPRASYYAGKRYLLPKSVASDMDQIAKSIISRQSTFLGSPIWKTVPWEDDPASKLSIDYLIDIGADVAGYIAQIKMCDNIDINVELEYSNLRTQVAASIEELNSWWHKWEAEHAQGVIEVPSSQTTSEPLFSTFLEYDTMWTAFAACNYDVMRILLLQLWNMLQRLPSSIPTIDQHVVLDMPNITALLGITSDIKSLACEILRSLKYCYGQSHRFVYTFSFFFIQDVAYGCFDRSSKEAIWISEHGWAELVNLDDIKDANLLRRMLPLGQIKGGDVSLGTSD